MKIKILGVTLDMELEELANPDVADKYEKDVAETVEIIHESMECEAGSEGIRKQCQAVIDAFTDIFGEKAAKDVLGERTNLFRCLDAFEEFVNIYPKQVTPEIEKRAEKYSRARIDGR